MKAMTCLALNFLFSFSFFNLAAQSISVNQDGSAPDPSSILDIQSTTKGFLTPRMSQSERDQILSPAIGLTIFQTDNISGYYYFNGVNWVPVSSAGGSGHWALSGNDIYNTNTGNVGINTTTPMVPLHINGDNDALRIQGSTPYISFYDDADTYKGFLWQGPGSNMSIGTSGGSSGHLQIYNDLNLNMAVHKDGEVDIYGSFPSLSLRDGLSALYGEIYKNENDLEITAKRTGFFGTPGNLILATSYSDPFSTFQIAGNVGIGTRTPSTKLHIAADGDLLRLEGIGYTYMSFYDGDIYKGFIVNDQNNMGFGTSTNNTTGSVWLYANNGIRLLVHPNGNVGIGTLNPTHKLSVNGTIRTKEVIVDSGWADYVFEEDYQLRDLAELEMFINENGHLPGVPSATQVQSDGLSVGDMQRCMMEKIEELSLYIISLSKEIEYLKSENK